MQQACTHWRCTAPCTHAIQGAQYQQRAIGAQHMVLARQAVAGACASIKQHRHSGGRVHRRVRACAEAKDSSRPVAVAVGAGLAGVAVVLALQLLDVDLEDALFGDGLSRDDFSLGNAAAAVLWSTSLWFASPLQLLLLFLGKIDTERPSDWAMNGVGRLAGQPVDNLDYQHPVAVRAAALLGTVVAGCATAFVLNVGLGDATWGVSSGIASCLAAGVYELGRPERLSVSKAQKLETQWQAFERFAEQQLQKGGRCHENEIRDAFERSNPSHRAGDARIEQKYLRDMVLSWHRGAQRTSGGFYKNVSLRPTTDPFTGSAQGTDLSSVGSTAEKS